MRRLSGDDCYDAKSCPAIFEWDDQTVIVQGRVIEAGFPADHASVEVPASVLLEARQRLERRLPAAADRAGDSTTVVRTDPQTVIVRGRHLVIDELTVPAWEATVMIPVDALIRAAEELA